MIDYKLWASRMLESGKCDTFGKQIKWRRTALRMSLKDLSKVVRLSVFILSNIERDSEHKEFALLSGNSISYADAKNIIDEALTLLEDLDNE